MAKFPWLKLRKKTQAEFPVEPPIWMGNHSNGEYFHPQTKREAAMRKEILRRADEKSRKLGIDRREFLASSAGLFTTMVVINQMGCSSTSDGPPAKPSPGGDGGDGKLFDFGNGPYVVPKE